MFFQMHHVIRKVNNKILKAVTQTMNPLINHLPMFFPDMIEMDGKKAPQDKLECITNCCNHICSAIASTQKSLASADDFFPTLIYVLLMADPPRLWSNIQYISRFSNSKRLIAGMEAYCFTNLVCFPACFSLSL